MPIPAKEPLQVEPVPATEAQTYDSLWAHRIIIGMPDATSGMVRIDFSHYDAETGDVTPSDSAASENISIEDLPAAIAEVPEVEAAMAAIITAIAALQAWQDAKDLPAEEPPATL